MTRSVRITSNRVRSSWSNPVRSGPAASVTSHPFSRRSWERRGDDHRLVVDDEDPLQGIPGSCHGFLLRTAQRMAAPPATRMTTRDGHLRGSGSGDRLIFLRGRPVLVCRPPCVVPSRRGPGGQGKEQEKEEEKRAGRGERGRGPPHPRTGEDPAAGRAGANCSIGWFIPRSLKSCIDFNDLEAFADCTGRVRIRQTFLTFRAHQRHPENAIPPLPALSPDKVLGP